MTIDINDLLTTILYLSLIILIVIFIIFGIKLIKTLKKVDGVIDDVNSKMNKVDGVFDLIDKTTDYASNISDKIIGTIANFINVLFHRKKGKDDDEQE